MTEQEKQIEEMAKCISEKQTFGEYCVGVIDIRSVAYTVVPNEEIAKHLTAKGYRKVILCKDCKYWDSDGKFCSFKGQFISNFSNINEESFCYRAKMRGE